MAFAINGQTRDLQGIILPGGTIARLGGSCRKETFEVTSGVLVVDGFGVPTGGAFHVKLTHYGFRMPGGGCVTFFATVEGLITVNLP